MKPFKVFFFLIAAIGLVGALSAQEMIIKESASSAEETVKNLKSTIKSMDLNLVEHIDHSKAARKANLQLPATHVLVFGNPEVGTKLMKEDPKVAIELPMKILVWEENGQTKVGYKDPVHMSQAYNLDNQREILSNMREVLDKITNEGIR